MKDEYDFSKGKRGALISTEGMTRVGFYIENETLEGLRKQAEKAGTGYQSLINGILKDYLNQTDNESHYDRQAMGENGHGANNYETMLVKETGTESDGWIKNKVSRE